MTASSRHDVIVLGAGTAGIPCAIEAAQRGAEVLLLDKADDVGGALHVSGGHMAAAGTRRQRAAGIDDSPERHLADIERISRGTAREDITRLAVEHAPQTVDWLDDHGFEFADGTPRIVFGHEPYTVPRTVYGPDEGRSILAVLRRLLQPHVASGKVVLRLLHEVVDLIADDGRVRGVIATGPDGTVEASATNTVLATGGFGASRQLFRELEEAPLVSAAHPTSTGDGLRLARTAGAGLQGRGTYIPTFGGLQHPEDPSRVRWSDRPLLVAPERAPWEIYVDRGGRRFVAEDEESIDRKERALADVQDLTFFQIFDDLAVEHSPKIVAGWTNQELRSQANERAGVFSAPDIETLAAAAGIEPLPLEDTVKTYNSAVEENRPDPLGRIARPTTIDHPPYYAIQNHGITLITFTGVDVDDQLRVRRDDGRVIHGLYAAGEVLGASATMGNAFCSGMSVTPALTFGRLLGQQLH